MSRPAPFSIGNLGGSAKRGPNRDGEWYWRIRTRNKGQHNVWQGWGTREAAQAKAQMLASPRIILTAGERERLAQAFRAHSESCSTVYIIGRCDGVGPVKVGFTSQNVAARLAQIQTGHPFELSVLAAFAGTMSAERWLHWKLRHHRLNGEWFARDAVRELLAKAGVLDSVAWDRLPDRRDPPPDRAGVPEPVAWVGRADQPARLGAPRGPVSPCKCKHPLHTGRTCHCGCERSCPDYVAGARAAGRKPTKADRRYTREMVLQTGWRSPRNAHPRIECAFCPGEFFPRRRDQRYCCGDCQTRYDRAARREMPPVGPASREACFSRERQWATGNGLLLPREAYELELRVWRAHQVEAA